MKSDDLQETADLVTFIEEILNGKLHFLCGVKSVLRNHSSDILEKILEILTKFLQLSSQTLVFSSTCKSSKYELLQRHFSRLFPDSY